MVAIPAIKTTITNHAASRFGFPIFNAVQDREGE